MSVDMVVANDIHRGSHADEIVGAQLESFKRGPDPKSYSNFRTAQIVSCRCFLQPFSRRIESVGHLLH